MEVLEISSIPIKNNIKKFRKIKAISQEDLADELSVTRSYLSKLENQRFSPGPELMFRICVFFHVGLGQMFYIE